MKKFHSRLIAIALILSCSTLAGAEEPGALKIGWIGAMTGPVAKYGAYQAALLAQDDINAAGGIKGRKLELVFEDGKCDPKTAVNAAMKLINVDKVHFIIGGHCTPESLPISSLAERNKTIMLAAITSSPKLSEAGDYIFRVTAVSTQGVDLQVPYAAQQLKLKRLAIISEETDYARPLAEHFQETFPATGGEVVAAESYTPGESDFRAILTKIKSKNPDAIYLGVQAPDRAVLILQQMRDLGIHVKIFGNEITGNAFQASGDKKDLFEGLIFPEPQIDWNAPATHDFVERFKKRFNVELPYGFWSAEAYDAVMLMAKVIGECGDDVEKVKACLYATKGYPGISGSVGIDTKGDGIRTYLLKIVENGQIKPL